MFSSTSPGLFKTVPCPGGHECKILNCLFLHEPKTNSSPSAQSSAPQSTKPTKATSDDEQSDFKRRKLSDASKAPVSYSHPTTFKPSKPSANATAVSSLETSTAIPSATKNITPPPTAKNSSGQNTGKKKIVLPEQPQPLMPRPIHAGKVQHGTRLGLLKALYSELHRLNKLVADDKDASIAALKMSPNALVKFAVDTEADALAKQSAIYVNVVKNLIIRYKKMTMQQWVELRREEVKNAQSATTVTTGRSKDEGPVKLDTGLSVNEELDLLDRFILRPEQLKQADFIVQPPTEEEVAEARKTTKSLGGYETCDRCASRFQVYTFPKEDGSLASGGHCTYHWARPIRPSKEKGALERPHASYPCCGQATGAPGCTTATHHVFKISAANVGRLGNILQFERTPENPNVQRIAVAFDCEMGYTTCGMELIRLSALKWPTNEPMIDVLVRPHGRIFDLNTKWSGVTMEQWHSALPIEPGTGVPLTEPDTASSDGTKSTPRMKMLASPSAARRLLTSFISPKTVLIGHAIDNDLNVVRLIHPSIVDTSLLYPHSSGLPFRYGLKRLAKDWLNLTIQTQNDAKPAGSTVDKEVVQGHDSMEDSRAAGDLVRFKIMREWQKLKSQGWSVKDGQFYATIGGQPKKATLPPYHEAQGFLKKRKAEDATTTANDQWPAYAVKEAATS